MKNILITGGAGFIGINLIFFLKTKNLNVIALDNFSSKSSKKNGKLIQDLGIPIINHDLKHPLKINSGVDVIIHLAATCSTSKSIVDPYNDFLNNTLSTLSVLEFSRKNDTIPIIYTSTCKVYSTEVNTLPIREGKLRYILSKKRLVNENFSIDGKQLYSHTPYGCSKYVGDLYCQEYFHTYGIPTIINRLSTVYGQYQYGTEESGWVYHFIQAKKYNKKVTIFGNGKQVRDCLWAGDLAELLFLEIKLIKKFGHRIYNVGGGLNNSLSLLELVNLLNRKGGNNLRVAYNKKRKGDFNTYISNLTKVTSETGWKPKVNINDGVDKIFNSL